MEHRKINKPEHKGKKGLAAFSLASIFIFGLMVALQVGVFMALAYNASLSKGMSYCIQFYRFL